MKQRIIYVSKFPFEVCGFMYFSTPKLKIPFFKKPNHPILFVWTIVYFFTQNNIFSGYGICGAYAILSERSESKDLFFEWQKNPFITINIQYPLSFCFFHPFVSY